MQSGKEIKVIKCDERPEAQATLSQKEVVLDCDSGQSRRDIVTVVTGSYFNDEGVLL